MVVFLIQPLGIPGFPLNKFSVVLPLSVGKSWSHSWFLALKSPNRRKGLCKWATISARSSCLISLFGEQYMLHMVIELGFSMVIATTFIVVLVILGFINQYCHYPVFFPAMWLLPSLLKSLGDFQSLFSKSVPWMHATRILYFYYLCHFSYGPYSLDVPLEYFMLFNIEHFIWGLL